MEKTIKYIGLDVHKDTIQVAIALCASISETLTP